MPAWGYVRKSRMDEDSPTQSPAVQEEKIRLLASGRGDDADLVIAPDLNVSGGKAMDERPAFAEMVEAIRDGACTAVYAYDLSRLFRNLKEQIAFFELTTERRVPVRLVSGDVGEVSGSTGKLMLDVLGAMNEWQRTNTSEKIRASLDRRERETGRRNGGRPYGEVRPVLDKAGNVVRMAGVGEDPGAVVRAYRETESLHRAAGILNAAKVPTRNGKSRGWSPAAVHAVVKRLAPELLRDPINARGEGSRAGPRDHKLARLLRCGVCGAIMTPSVDARRNYTRYYCHGSRGFLPHGRGTVAERALMTAIIEEVGHAQAAIKRLRVGSADDDAKLADIEAERSRVKTLFRKGHIPEAELDEAMAELDEQESRLSAMRWVKKIPVPPVLDGEDADPPEKINAYLRRLFVRIDVDLSTPDKRGSGAPLVFTWRDPSMRVEDPEDVSEVGVLDAPAT